MKFDDIVGQEQVKKHLIQSVKKGRVAHAQLFVGPEGSGTLPVAIAYARHLLCQNNERENFADDALCNRYFKNFSHPDLHYVFPVTTSNKVRSKPLSSHYLEEWRKMLSEQVYGSLYDWYSMIGVDNKQGKIGVEEAQQVLKKLSLKSYLGGLKVVVIWMADKMNISASNKLLKLIEEPPKDSIFLLLTTDETKIIETIKSRCQTLYFPPLQEYDIVEGLVKRYDIDRQTALQIAKQSEGDFNKACNFVNRDSEDGRFEQWFILWVRTAFRAKGNRSSIHDLISWSDQIAKTGRETQKLFLQYCLNFFRQALMVNYGVNELCYLQTKAKGFEIKKFAPFVHENNIVEIVQLLQEAIVHIERNGNSKIVLTDLSIKLTRQLHKKSTPYIAKQSKCLS